VEVKTQNVVALIRLASPVHSSHLNGAMKKARFPGAILKLNLSGATVTALVFNGSRNIVLTGARSVSQAYRAVDKLISILKSLGAVESAKADVEIANIVATGYMGFRIDILKLVTKFENIIYEPDDFPGVIYWFNGLVFLLFSTGKFVSTGARSIRAIANGADVLRRRLIKSGVAVWR